MVKKAWIVLLLIAFAGSTILVSCKGDPAPTTGQLTLYVYKADVNGAAIPVPWEQVYLATSYNNLISHQYVLNGWTNTSGEVIFYDLAPGIYWFDTEHWEDYGASGIYAGYDNHEFLWVNTPQPK